MKGDSTDDTTFCRQPYGNSLEANSFSHCQPYGRPYINLPSYNHCFARPKSTFFISSSRINAYLQMKVEITSAFLLSRKESCLMQTPESWGKGKKWELLEKGCGSKGTWNGLG